MSQSISSLADIVDRARMSADFLALQRQGYVVVKAAVQPETCAEIHSGIVKFKSMNARYTKKNLDEHERLYRVVNLHLAVRAIGNLLTQNRAISVCDEFFGEPTSLYTSLYYERGSEQSLHRDTPLFCTKPPLRYLGVWVALEEVRQDNGPLCVVPKSHLLPDIDIKQMRREDSFAERGRMVGLPSGSPAASRGSGAHRDAPAC